MSFLTICRFGGGLELGHVGSGWDVVRVERDGRWRNGGGGDWEEVVVQGVNVKRDMEEKRGSKSYLSGGREWKNEGAVEKERKCEYRGGGGPWLLERERDFDLT